MNDPEITEKKVVSVHAKLYYQYYLLSQQYLIYDFL